MRVVILISLISLVFFSHFAFASPPLGSPFIDFPSDHWAFNEVNGGVMKGYVDGFKDRTFRPEMNVTRAEFIKMLVVASEFPICDCPDTIFKDVSHDHWATPFIKTSIKEGIVFPLEYNYLLHPHEPITRIEMARMAVRALIGKVEGPMYEAVKRGVLNGYPTTNGTMDLKPDGLPIAFP